MQANVTALRLNSGHYSLLPVEGSIDARIKELNKISAPGRADPSSFNVVLVPSISGFEITDSVYPYVQVLLVDATK